MKVLITGATGFVGSHLCDKLSEQGHEVYALVRNEQKALNLELPGKYITGNLDEESISSWVKKLPSDLDCVIHTAGVVSAKHSLTFAKTNQLATQDLINELSKRYEKLHFLLISSQAAAGPSQSPIDEAHECNPVSAYGHSKLAAEQALRELAPESWNSTIIRPPMVIGPRDSAVLDVFKMVKSRFVTGPGLGFRSKRYSVVNVFDLVDAIILCAKQQSPKNEVYYVTSVDEVTFEELINAISSTLGVKKVFFMSIPIWILRIVAGALYTLPIHLPLTRDKINELEAHAWLCKSEKIKALGHIPQHDLRSTIEMTAKDYQGRNWL
ncbi:NAD-dependent epimerase/dehydratase family protein [Halobacteriovorax sp. YZS-1-1]|uniref:NAD-dependent epimerase/dehydratase family protein n=1 Tax=unclassified Halobacteriovorax TaxID=2639665 RepID=UPI003999E398